VLLCKTFFHIQTSLCCLIITKAHKEKVEDAKFLK